MYDKTQDASDFIVRIALLLNDGHVVKPLLLEQSAYEFLYLQQFRKFAFYMTLASHSYRKVEYLDLSDYSFNCLATVHAFY